jgi:hypothetical protein
MFRTLTIQRSALVVLLAGAVVATSEAQTPPPGFDRTASFAGGLSTLPASVARFHVALDDDTTEPDIFVVMRIIDQAGTVIRSKTANIAAGRSATLEYRGPSVLYRFQAEIFEPQYLVNRTLRRTAMIYDSESSSFTAAAAKGFLLVGPGPIDPPPLKFWVNVSY